MMKKAMIATALMLAGGAVMAGEGYTDLVNSTGGSKSTVPVAKASAKSIAGEKAYAISAAEFLRMTGIVKPTANKSLAGNKPYMMDMNKMAKAVENLRRTRDALGGMEAVKNSVELRKRYMQLCRMIRSYECFAAMIEVSGGTVKIPSKNDAAAELVAKSAEKFALQERLEVFVAQGIYFSPETKELTDRIIELDRRIWFLETILQ